jgi:iron complex transport system ATP-binding protein
MVADGPPAEVINIDLLKDVFRVRAENAITPGGIRALVPLDLL